MVAALRNTVGAAPHTPFAARVEYIAGNNNQTAYIQTPYIPETDDVINAKVYRRQSNTSWIFNWIFNTEDHWYGNTSAIGVGTSFGLGWGEPRLNFGRGWKGSANGWVSGINEIKIESQRLYVNGTLAVDMHGASLFGTSWLALLGNHRGNSVIECATPYHGVGTFRVERSNEVIHDFVAVRVVGAGGVSEGAIYDYVTDSLYPNQGTGGFTIGPDI